MSELAIIHSKLSEQRDKLMNKYKMIKKQLLARIKVLKEGKHQRIAQHQRKNPPEANTAPEDTLDALVAGSIQESSADMPAPTAAAGPTPAPAAAAGPRSFFAQDSPSRQVLQQRYGFRLASPKTRSEIRDMRASSAQRALAYSNERNREAIASDPTSRPGAGDIDVINITASRLRPQENSSSPSRSGMGMCAFTLLFP